MDASGGEGSDALDVNALPARAALRESAVDALVDASVAEQAGDGGTARGAALRALRAAQEAFRVSWVFQGGEGPDAIADYLLLAASCATLGRADEAQRALADVAPLLTDQASVVEEAAGDVAAAASDPTAAADRADGIGEGALRLSAALQLAASVYASLAHRSAAERYLTAACRLLETTCGLSHAATAAAFARLARFAGPVDDEDEESVGGSDGTIDMADFRSGFSTLVARTAAQAAAHFKRGEQARDTGDYPAAVRHLLCARYHWAGVGDDLAVARADYILGLTRREQGLNVACFEALERAYLLRRSVLGESRDETQGEGARGALTLPSTTSHVSLASATLVELNDSLHKLGLGDYIFTDEAADAVISEARGSERGASGGDSLTGAQPPLLFPHTPRPGSPVDPIEHQLPQIGTLSTHRATSGPDSREPHGAVTSDVWFTPSMVRTGVVSVLNTSDASGLEGEDAGAGHSGTSGSVPTELGAAIVDFAVANGKRLQVLAPAPSC